MNACFLMDAWMEIVCVCARVCMCVPRIVHIRIFSKPVSSEGLVAVTVQ